MRIFIFICLKTLEIIGMLIICISSALALKTLGWLKPYQEWVRNLPDVVDIIFLILLGIGIIGIVLNNWNYAKWLTDAIKQKKNKEV